MQKLELKMDRKKSTEILIRLSFVLIILNVCAFGYFLALNNLYFILFGLLAIGTSYLHDKFFGEYLDEI